MDNSVRILNFDDSIIKQTRFLSSYDKEIIDLKDLGPYARFWASEKIKDAIKRRIKNTRKNAVTFLGSGDFHHVSGILIDEFQGPFSVIQFDSHPDWSILPFPLNCGSWVTETLRDKKIQKYLMVGVSFLRSLSLSVQAADFALLRNDRLEVYSYSDEESIAFFRNIPPNISLQSKNNIFFTRLKWRGITGKNPEEFASLIRRIPTKSVYITIDKDCLKKEYALTNWQEGKMSFGELVLMLKIIKENFDIIGVDITGDYSPVIIKGIAKKSVSYIDHPRSYSARNLDLSYVTKINEDTNLKIMKFFAG